MMKCTIVTPFSENRKLTDKTVAVASTTRIVGPTCPSNCKMLKDRSCYAMKGYPGIHQRRAKDIHDDLQVVADKGVKHLRLNVSGDFFWKGRFDKVYVNQTISFAKKNGKITIWGYTHCWKSFDKHNIEHKNINNLTILASCDTLDDTKKARENGWLTARVVESFDNVELLPGEAKCLNQTVGTTCVKCGICFNKHPNFKGVVFRKH